MIKKYWKDALIVVLALWGIIAAALLFAKKVPPLIDRGTAVYMVPSKKALRAMVALNAHFGMRPTYRLDDDMGYRAIYPLGTASKIYTVLDHGAHEELGFPAASDAIPVDDPQGAVEDAVVILKTYGFSAEVVRVSGESGHSKFMWHVRTKAFPFGVVSFRPSLMDMPGGMPPDWDD